MKILKFISFLTICVLPVLSHAAIFVSGSTSRSAGGTCRATIKSIGTCYSPSDIFHFKVATQSGLVEFDSNTVPPKGYNLRYSTNALEGVVDGYILQYKYAGRSAVTVSRTTADGTTSEVGKGTLNCIQ